MSANRRDRNSGMLLHVGHHKFPVFDLVVRVFDDSVCSKLVNVARKE